MSITNVSKPSSSYSNITKPSFGEIWNTDLNTWTAETRTWNDTGSLIDNTSKISSSFTNVVRP